VEVWHEEIGRRKFSNGLGSLEAAEHLDHGLRELGIGFAGWYMAVAGMCGTCYLFAAVSKVTGGYNPEWIHINSGTGNGRIRHTPALCTRVQSSSPVSIYIRDIEAVTTALRGFYLKWFLRFRLW
jgi:hypothetical protein